MLAVKRMLLLCENGGKEPENIRGYSSTERAFLWQRKGWEFESPYLHHEQLV